MKIHTDIEITPAEVIELYQGFQALQSEQAQQLIAFWMKAFVDTLPFFMKGFIKS